MAVQEDKQFGCHALNKSLQTGIHTIPQILPFTNVGVLEKFRGDLCRNPILAISMTSNFSLFTTTSVRTLILGNDNILNNKEYAEAQKLITQWWKDPSIRKLVNIGSIPSNAINATMAADIMMDITGYIDKIWFQYFGFYNQTRMAFRSNTSLTFVNLVILKFADEKLKNRGLPFGSLFEMNVCKKCGYPDGVSPHNHDNEFVTCTYPICDKKKGHLVRVCGVLQGLCYDCGQVGHMARSHKLYRPDVLMKTYASHREFGILYPLGLEVFARRRNFLSQDDFEPMTVNNETSSYSKRYNGSSKGDDVLKILLNNCHVSGCQDEEVNKEADLSTKHNLFLNNTKLWNIWEGKANMSPESENQLSKSFNKIISDTYLPSFFSCDIVPRELHSLESSNEETSNSDNEISENYS